jgi:hypothetical protein
VIIYLLSGENERAHHPHQGNCDIIHIILDLFRAISDQPGRSRLHSAAYGRGYQCVSHMHYLGSFLIKVSYPKSRNFANKKPPGISSNRTQIPVVLLSN